MAKKKTKKRKSEKRKQRRKKIREKTEAKKEKKLRILAIGDLHGDTMQAKKLAQLAAEKHVDYVVLTGDLTFAETSTDYLIGPFAKHKLKVLLVPGNHETLATANFLTDLYSPYVYNLHGKAIKTKNTGIFGCGGANIGLFQLPEKDIYSTLHKGFSKVKKERKKIMVTHVHPSGTLMGKLTTVFPGSTGVRKAIKRFKPDLALCSHVHEAAGIEEHIGKTRVVNVGRKGKIIEI